MFGLHYVVLLNFRLVCCLGLLVCNVCCLLVDLFIACVFGLVWFCLFWFGCYWIVGDFVVADHWWLLLRLFVVLRL